MRFINAALILVAVAILSACNATDNAVKMAQPMPDALPGTPGSDGVNRVTTAELEALIKDKRAFVVDVRGADAYDLGHIPGAKLIPAGEVLNHVSELPRDKVIVTYCA